MWDPGRLSCLLPSHSWNSNTVLLQHVGSALCFLLHFIQCLLSGWHLPVGHPYHFSGSSCLYFSACYFPLCSFLYLASVPVLCSYWIWEPISSGPGLSWATSLYLSFCGYLSYLSSLQPQAPSGLSAFDLTAFFPKSYVFSSW